MRDNHPPVIVRILDKDYQVACPPEERRALQKAAEELDERMRTIRRSGSIVGLDRIAVMAALNLCHELQEAQQRNPAGDDSSLERMADKLDKALKR